MSGQIGGLGNSEISQPLLSALANSYGSIGAAQASNQNPIQVNPAALARAMQIITASQSSQPSAPQIAQPTVQQTLSLPEGQYVGDVKDGVPHGRGTLTYHPGMELKKYEGQWEKGKFHGRGVLKYSNERRYEGQWENGLRHGKGIEFYANGAKYEGDFFHDKKQGKGKMRYADGDTYDGGWENNKFHGQGTHKQTDGTTFSGEWFNDQLHGQGYRSFPSGTYARGTFNYDQLWNGELHGPGHPRVLYKNGAAHHDCYYYCNLACTIL